MKTTLIIDDQVMERLRAEALRQRRTISELVEAALRLFLDKRAAPARLPPLPSFDGKGARVDISNRESLYRVMEEEGD